jgi:hypothetical protein
LQGKSKADKQGAAAVVAAASATSLTSPTVASAAAAATSTAPAAREERGATLYNQDDEVGRSFVIMLCAEFLRRD